MTRPTAPLDVRRVAAAARRLLAGGVVGDADLRAAGRIGAPLPVMSPQGTQHAWFVPVSIGDRLAAFLLLQSDGTPLRCSSFQRRPGDLAGCPAAADWLDSARIRVRAAVRARPGEQVGEPVLSFDGTPERIAWAVPLAGAGATRLVYVAGDSVYEAGGGSGLG